MSVGVITIDGTKIKSDASMDQNRGYGELVKEILREAHETDRREDEVYGDQRGDELPEQLRTAEVGGRRLRKRSGAWLSARAARQMTRHKPEPESWRSTLRLLC